MSAELLALLRVALQRRFPVEPLPDEFTKLLREFDRPHGRHGG